jgi:hypothetical protein
MRSVHGLLLGSTATALDLAQNRTALPQQFHSREMIAINPIAPHPFPAANFSRERWFDATAGQTKTVATYKDGSTEGQFVDVPNDRQCSFQSTAGDSDDVTCRCQKIPVGPHPLTNQLSLAATFTGLAQKLAWGMPNATTCEVWQVFTVVPGSIAKPSPVIETCDRFVEHAPPHRDVTVECSVCPVTSPAQPCGSGAEWLERAPFAVYEAGPPSRAALRPPPQCE